MAKYTPEGTPNSSASFEMESVPNCPLCDCGEQHDARGSSWNGVPFSYAICKGCGLKYMRPRPTTESLKQFYFDEYWQRNMSGTGYASSLEYGDENTDQMALRMPKYRRVYEHVRNDLLATVKLSSQTRILEVGCAFGFTLEWLHRDFDCQVFGIEPSSEAIERCAEGGVPIVGRTAEEFAAAPPPPDDEKYDVILYRQALDPIIDPVGVLKGTRKHLKDDGLLLIHCVNVEFCDQMDPYHPILYSPSTIRRLLMKSGYQVFRHDHTPSPSSHEVAVRIDAASYQQMVFARKGEEVELPQENPDPIEILKTIERGKMVMAWQQLRPQELLLRAGQRSWERSREQVEGVFNMARERLFHS